MMIDLKQINYNAQYIIADSAGPQFAGLILQFVPEQVYSALIMNVGMNLHGHLVGDHMIFDSGDEVHVELLIEHELHISFDLKDHMFQCSNCHVYINVSQWRKNRYQQVVQCRPVEYQGNNILLNSGGSIK
jgi:hypothetical protein